MKLLSFDAVISLIKQGGFGSYLAFNNLGGELIFGSHITDENNKDILAMNTDVLIEDLQSKVDLHGYGSYKLLLKKNNKTPNANAVVYRFEVKPEGSTHEMGGMSGTASIDYIQSQVDAKVAIQVAAIEERLKKDREIYDLKKEIEEIKKGGGSMSVLDGLVELGKMSLGLIIAKTSPEVVPMISAMLGNISEQEAPKPRPFTRTD